MNKMITRIERWHERFSAWFLICGHHSCDIRFRKIDNSLNGTFNFSNREAWAEERLS
jgi:hypothetical protein